MDACKFVYCKPNNRQRLYWKLPLTYRSTSFDTLVNLPLISSDLETAILGWWTDGQNDLGGEDFLLTSAGYCWGEGLLQGHLMPGGGDVVVGFAVILFECGWDIIGVDSNLCGGMKVQE